ncbi:MAG TPA: hypothetical protein ENH03_02210 [Candidatus Bathyarchaeota archaeon]|nr:hypothetical protein [Candidatus Bathyarchaeota archaeon]
MGRRFKVKGRPGYYVVRDRRGRFKRWAKINRSIRVDSRKKVPQTRKEHGYGHLTDYRRKR